MHRVLGVGERLECSVECLHLFIARLVTVDLTKRSGVHKVFSECSIWMLVWLVAVAMVVALGSAVVDGTELWFIRDTHLHSQGMARHESEVGNG